MPAQDSEHTVPLKYHCQEGTRCFSFPFEVSLCSLKQTSSSTIESSKRRRRRHAIKCLVSGRKAQATKDVLAACLATRCNGYRHKLGETEALSLLVFDLHSALFCHAFSLPVCWTAEVSATSALLAWQPMKQALSKKKIIRLIFAEAYP